MEHCNFLFFWEQANPQTGLVKDRCNVRAKDTTVVASVASTGFGLTAICIGEKRGFISRAEARLRVISSLSFLWHKLPTHRGSSITSPISTRGEGLGLGGFVVDTAILLCGVSDLPSAFSGWRDHAACAGNLRSRGTGHGCQRTRPCCPRAGRLSSAFCLLNGTSTAN